MRALASAGFVLMGLLPAQEPRFNLVLPQRVTFDVVLWNGEAALVLLAPETARLAVFLDPTLTSPRMSAVQLYPQVLAVLDTRPCAVGAHYELWYADRHVPELGGTLPASGFGLGTQGMHFGIPMQFRTEQPVATEWYVSYCSMLWCTSSCPAPVRGPEWTAALVTVRLN